MKNVSTSSLKKKKEKREPITMITAYDYPTAKLVDQAGTDIILVGDSLGMVVLGYTSTIPVTIADMVHHTKAAVRGTKRAMVVTDLPFLSYHGSIDATLAASATLMQEAGAQAVKLEGGAEMAHTVKTLTSAGVPVMGHLGLTPQSVYQFGGYKVQGKDTESAQKLVADAQALENAGAFAIVLECIPAPVAKHIAERCSIPIIGIGAGADCDGQVLVFHDLVGLGSDISPKFAKKYTDAAAQILAALEEYVEEVKGKQFPTEKHSFTLVDQVMQELYGGEKE